MVVIFDVEHIPAPAFQTVLPARICPFQFPQIKGNMVEVHEQTIRFLGSKLDHHIQHRIIVLINVFQCLFGGNHRSFRQHHAVIVAEYITVEFFQIFVQSGTVIVISNTLGGRHDVIIRQAFLLGNERNHVFPETVHTHIQPKTQNIFDLFPNQRVIHIQVRLLHRKDVHVVFFSHLVPCPGFSLKDGIPVVGQFSIFFGRPPDVVIGIRIDPLPALFEPAVFGTGMVDHKIHDYFHTTFMRAIQHLLESLQTAEFFCDIIVIRNVIAAVHTGRGIQRREPDTVTA